MAQKPLFDISDLDQSRIAYDASAIDAVNPHRGAMRQLDGIFYCDPGFEGGVAFKDVRDDEFWVDGHIPGRPLMPGVLMIEAAAQFASFLSAKQGMRPEGGFLGFTGVEQAKFRGTVEPGDRLLILVEQVESRPRRFICQTQGLVEGRPVFEARVVGMPI